MNTRIATLLLFLCAVAGLASGQVVAPFAEDFEGFVAPTPVANGVGTTILGPNWDASNALSTGATPGLINIENNATYAPTAPGQVNYISMAAGANGSEGINELVLHINGVVSDLGAGWVIQITMRENSDEVDVNDVIALTDGVTAGDRMTQSGAPMVGTPGYGGHQEVFLLDWNFFLSTAGGNTSSTAWRTANIVIDNAFLTANGLTMTTDMRLVIRQDDNSMLTGGDGLLIDSVAILDANLTDIAVQSIDAPASSTTCSALSNAETVTCTFANTGFTTLAMGTMIPLELSVDAGIVATEVVNLAAPMMPGDTLQYTFTATADLSVLGPHTIDVLALFGDTNPGNDMASATVNSGVPIITTFPHLENFDALAANGNGSEIPPTDWTQDTNDGDNWDFRSGNTPSSNTGPMAGDHTSGTGVYAHTEDSNASQAVINLITPCIDVSALANPTMRFWVHSNAASGTDENFLAIDHIDANGVVTPDIIPQIGHVGDFWQEVLVPLTPYVGTAFQLQFRGRTDGPSFTHDIAIDDVEFFDLILPDLEMDPIVAPASSLQLTCGPLPSNTTVTVQIRNSGILVPMGTAVPVEYTYDDGINPATTVMESAVLANDLLPGGTTQYTFATGADLSTPGLYTFSAAVNLPADPNTANNTVTGHMVQSGGANVINTFPHVENFDTHTTTLNDTTPPTDWVQPQDDATGTNSDWFFRNTPTGSANTGPSGDHTTGTSWYAYVEDSANFDNVSLQSPCFDTSSLTTPFLTFWVHSRDANGTGPTNNTLSIDIIDDSSATVHSDVITIGHLGDFWQKVGLDLTPFASTGFRVQFRVNAQNGTFTHDIAIDDFEIGEAPVFGNGQAPVPGKGTLDVNAAQEANGFLVSSGVPGPYATSQAAGTGTLDFTIGGTANQPFVLIAGVPNPNSGNFPPIGQFDIGGTNPVPPFIPTGLTVVWDGTNPVFPGQLFNTGAAGSWTLSITTPNVPGLLIGLQAIVLTGDAQVGQLTNSVEVTTP